MSRQASRCQQAFSKPCLVNLISKDTHLVLSIYLQGRCVWWNPIQKEEEEFEDEEEEDREEAEIAEPEVGPPLLTPVSEDVEYNNTPPWSTKPSSNLIPQFSIAVVHSNLWPGAHAFATGK